MRFLVWLSTVALAFTAGFYASEKRQHYAPPAAVVNGSLGDTSVAPLSNQTSIDSVPAPLAPEQITALAPTANPSSSPVTSLAHARQLVAAGDYAQAARLLEELLQRDAAPELMLLLARIYEQQGRHEPAVALWLRYLNVELDAQKIDTALDYVARYLIRLVDNPAIFGAGQRWLMQQLNDLIKLTPDNGELHLQLAKMHLNTDDKEQAQYHGLMAANQVATQARAEALLATLSASNLPTQVNDEVVIPLERLGKQFLVPVSIAGTNARLLLDTGASITGLTSAFIQRHSRLVNNAKPITLNTASGAVESYLFVVDSFALDEIQFTQHMLAHLPMDNAGQFDGLLGVDILGRFEFVIDQENAQLRLRKRE